MGLLLCLFRMLRMILKELLLQGAFFTWMDILIDVSPYFLILLGLVPFEVLFDEKRGLIVREIDIHFADIL